MADTNREIKITINLPGQYIEITRERGWGDNPRFFANQVEAALDEAKESIRGMIAAEHGSQSVEPPLNEPKRVNR